jgi:hypothetical protein
VATAEERTEEAEEGEEGQAAEAEEGAVEEAARTTAREGMKQRAPAVRVASKWRGQTSSRGRPRRRR